MIAVERLSKAYGVRRAVDSVSFTVQPGKITGFLGPNGAGKSTSMRLILGLARPDGGNASINGKSLCEHADPLRQVGALLEADGAHPGRTARKHLQSIAATHHLARHRVDEVIELAGLDEIADVRVSKFSLGMRQRLGLAVALLGDPEVLILDEPTNGLDPDGVLWLRQLLRRLATEGRTVFLSSHLMSELSITADHVIIIGRGRVVEDAPLAAVLEGVRRPLVRVASPGADRLRAVLEARGAHITPIDGVSIDGVLHVTGMSSADVGRFALAAGIAVSELGEVQRSLETAYLELTRNEVQYRARSER